MKSIHYVFVVLTLLIILNCKNTNLCNNELSIFEVHDSIPKIKISETDSRDQIITKFQDKFGEEFCYEDLAFGLQTSDEMVKMYFILY